MAHTAADGLLQLLGIAKVFCVDDVYAQRWSLDDIQAAQLELSAEQLLSIIPDLAARIPEDQDARREVFRAAWARLDGPAQEELAPKILTAARQKSPAVEDDTGDASVLREIVGRDRLVELAPAEWTKSEPQIMADAARERFLVLFDQDLSLANESATGGMAFVKNVLAKDPTGKLMCGLLTHTATIDNEHQRWEEYAAKDGVDRDRFVLVSKQWLSLDPVGFARMLKLVALSPDCAALKRSVKTIIESVTNDSAQQVDKISVFDFDHIVFRSCHTEGVWEPDMLLRLYGIFQRTAVRQKAHADAELGRLLDRVRQVSLIPTDSDSSPATTTWKLQQQEMYDSGDYINGLHLPIDIGDIFQKTSGGSTKSFILLGQPCDLMVRADGKRYPETEDVLLAEIAPLERTLPMEILVAVQFALTETSLRNVMPELAAKPLQESDARRQAFIDAWASLNGEQQASRLKVILTQAKIKAPREQKPYTELIPYFGDNREVEHVVMFRRVHVVNPYVLDLCAFHDDGVAHIDTTAVCPTGLMPAWKQRYEVSRQRAEEILGRYEKFGKNKTKDQTVEDAFRGDAIRLFPPSMANGGLFKGTVELSAGTRKLSFNCKRVKRLCRPRALALALQYAACFSRPAFDRDLGANVKQH